MNWLISFETEEASFTVRFEAADIEAAHARASYFISLLTDGKSKNYYITEPLQENN